MSWFSLQWKRILSLVISVFGVLSLATATAAAADKDISHAFKITIASTTDKEVEGKKQTGTGDTEFHYTWRHRGRERVLIFDSVRIKGTTDGKQLMDFFMNRAKIVNSEQGKTKEVLFENAPTRMKQMLQDSFGVPLCVLEVDENGKEVKRTVVAGPGAQVLVDNGMIANALLFHPQYLGDRDRE